MGWIWRCQRWFLKVLWGLYSRIFGGGEKSSEGKKSMSLILNLASFVCLCVIRGADGYGRKNSGRYRFQIRDVADWSVAELGRMDGRHGTDGGGP